MLSNYLIFRCPLLLLPSIFPSIGVFSNESALHTDERDMEEKKKSTDGSTGQWESCHVWPYVTVTTLEISISTVHFHFMCKLVMLGVGSSGSFGPERDPCTWIRTDFLLRRPFTRPRWCFLPPFQFVWFKIFNQRHNEVSHLPRSPRPLDGDFTLITLMNMLLTHANSGSTDTEMGGAQGRLSGADLITQPLGGQSRAIFSQLL